MPSFWQNVDLIEVLRSELDRGTLRSIIRRSSLNVNEFIDLLS